MSTFESTLPIFFYNNVLFPGSLLHLHLFEQRYRHMINRCISSNRKFIYLPNFSDYKASEGDLGLMAHVDECEFLPDGRALLKATLQDRVKVTKSWVEEGTQGLAYCTFTPYEEENKAVDEQELRATVQLSNAFLEKVPGLCQQIAHHIGEQPDPSSEPMRWSFWFAALVTTFSRMGHRAVVLLQETKTCERLKMAKKIFTSIVARSFTNSQQQQQQQQQQQDRLEYPRQFRSFHDQHQQHQQQQHQQNRDNDCFNALTEVFQSLEKRLMDTEDDKASVHRYMTYISRHNPRDVLERVFEIEEAQQRLRQQADCEISRMIRLGILDTGERPVPNWKKRGQNGVST